MQSASFRLSSYSKYTPIFSTAYVAGFFYFLQYLKKDEIDILSPIFVSVLIAIYLLTYSLSLLKLTIDEQKISFSAGPVRSSGWTILWSDVTEVLVIYGPLGSHRLLIKNTAKNRFIQLPMWKLEHASFPLAVQKLALFKIYTNRQPEDFSVFQAISFFRKDFREASSREAAEEINQRMDLGKEAGHVAFSAVAFTVTAVVARLADQSSTIDVGYVTYLAGGVAIAAGLFMLYYMRKCPNFFANIFIGLLGGGCAFWAFYASLMATTYFVGEKATFTYQLKSQDDTHQVWKTSANEALLLKIYAKPDNVKYTDLDTTKKVVLIKGVFNNYSISRSMTQLFVIDPSRK
jgi:hypothetical protein